MKTQAFSLRRNLPLNTRFARKFPVNPQGEVSPQQAASGGASPPSTTPLGSRFCRKITRQKLNPPRLRTGSPQPSAGASGLRLGPAPGFAGSPSPAGRPPGCAPRRGLPSDRTNVKSAPLARFCLSLAVAPLVRCYRCSFAATLAASSRKYLVSIDRVLWPDKICNSGRVSSATF